MNQLWTTWGIDLDDTEARNYAAGALDEDVDRVIKITLGKSILRVEVGATKTQVPVLGKLHARWTGKTSVLTYINARMFLEYVAPYVVCTRPAVLAALDAWHDVLSERKRRKNRMIEIAGSIPKVVC
jgi:hypothetical protein